MSDGWKPVYCHRLGHYLTCQSPDGKTLDLGGHVTHETHIMECKKCIALGIEPAAATTRWYPLRHTRLHALPPKDPTEQT